jgi:tRNA 2-selenouridine synthase
MTRPINHTANPWSGPWTEIIDVRSPAEFAEDHIPGAINLPVLNNEERAKVGTLYVQSSPFLARKVGAALVAQNIGQHLQAHFIEQDRDYQPLVYCWRGGQRSGSLATVLAAIGWGVTVLEGGYKTYRRLVQGQLSELPRQFTFHVLCGPTGSGKTHLLHALAPQAQVLDLEAIANHRGSLLGKVSTQPSQKYFDSLLLARLQQFDPAQPVWVEAESSKIGQVYLPQSLLTQMNQGLTVALEVPIAQRVNWILQGYPHYVAQPDLLKAELKSLTSRYGHAQIQQWFHWIDHGELAMFVESILRVHYDPCYFHALNQHYAQMNYRVELADFAPESISKATQQLLIFSA